MRPRLACVTGHYGEFLQGRMGPDGPVALVTLPCPKAVATARRVGDGAFGLTGAPMPHVHFARTARALGHPIKGRYGLNTSQPLGAGAGMSTALLLAVARAAGLRALPAQWARACVKAEGASDPLMMPEPATHLWASRQGRSLRRLPQPPRFDVVGGLWGPCLPTDPADRDFADISDLVTEWTTACSRSDTAYAATLAAEGALRNLEQRGPTDDPTAHLARDLGALGWAMSHTGAARTLLFAPGTAPKGAEAALQEAGLRRTLRFGTGP